MGSDIYIQGEQTAISYDRDVTTQNSLSGKDEEHVPALAAEPIG